MTQGLSAKYRHNVAGLALLFTFAAVGFSSCEKKIDPEGQHVTGVFQGKNCYSSPVPNVTVNQGSDNETILIPTAIGVNVSCNKIVDIVGKVGSGYITINSQNFTDACGNPAVVTGSGNVTGHELYYDMTVVYTVSGRAVTSHICFAGRK